MLFRSLLVFEINPPFIEELEKIKDNRLHIYAMGAEKAASILKENHFGHADYVVSSLPLAIIPNSIVTRIISRSYSFLKKGNAYIQFQYSPRSLAPLKRVFDKVDVKFTAINVPPALVYVCWKK